MDKLFLTEFCRKISLPRAEIDTVFQMFIIYQKEIEQAVRRAKHKKVSAEAKRLLKKLESAEREPEILLAYAVACSEYTHRYYEKHKIPDTIFYGTMVNLTTHALKFRKETGRVGLYDVDWLQYHLSGALFQLGELQFRRYRMQFPEYVSRPVIRNAPIKRGKKCIKVYIPNYKTITVEKASTAMNEAQIFFDEHFPLDAYHGYVCHSWLLYPDTKTVFPKASFIIPFQKLWDCIAFHPDNTEAILEIFEKEYSSTDFYPENTPLQEKVKSLLQRGGTLGMGLGMIAFETTWSGFGVQKSL